MASAIRNRVRFPKLPPKLRAFCERLGITEYVPVVLRLIQESFPQATDPKIYEECDPESGEEWLAISVTVRGKRKDVQRQYDEYTDKKLQLVPWPQRDAICLLHWYQSQ